jgi:hypothetical protein
MKIKRIAIHSLALCLVFGLPIAACAGSKLIQTQRIASPPSGKALVNFHRPTAYGGNERVPIFDGTGKMLIDLPGKSEFQVVCDPGEQLFIAWADHVSVVKADLAADKTYDIMVDVGMGWMEANIRLTPLSKDDPRRAKLKSAKRMCGPWSETNTSLITKPRTRKGFNKSRRTLSLAESPTGWDI